MIILYYYDNIFDILIKCDVKHECNDETFSNIEVENNFLHCIEHLVFN